MVQVGRILKFSWQGAISPLVVGQHCLHTVERKLFGGEFPGKMAFFYFKRKCTLGLKKVSNRTCAQQSKEGVSPCSFSLPKSVPLGVIFIFAVSNYFSTECGSLRQRRFSAVCWSHTGSFFFYVNRDWWNILHRVRAFDKKYWWLLSVSVTWDDRTLHFKMNYTRNSLFGNVIHFISSVVLWENDWSHEYLRLNCFLCTL